MAVVGKAEVSALKIGLTNTVVLRGEGLENDSYRRSVQHSGGSYVLRRSRQLSMRYS